MTAAGGPPPVAAESPPTVCCRHDYVTAFCAGDAELLDGTARSSYGCEHGVASPCGLLDLCQHAIGTTEVAISWGHAIDAHVGAALVVPEKELAEPSRCVLAIAERFELPRLPLEGADGGSGWTPASPGA
ncbi:MAG: hypothetical protein JW751_13845 [Polyangiaceae bacterium]|nr:hypothetical protein [Polyangiaceae bacterium]